MAETRGLAQVFHVSHWVLAVQSQPSSRNTLGLDLGQTQGKFSFPGDPRSYAESGDLAKSYPKAQV